MLPLLTGYYTSAPPSKPVEQKLLRVSLGRFYPQKETGNYRTSLGISYQTKLRIGNLPAPHVYVDSNRKRNITNLNTTPATTSTKITVLQGLGLSWYTNQLPVLGKNTYTIKGIGLYQQRISINSVNQTGYSLGAKLGVGYQKDDLFAEAEYTLVGRIKGNDPSGLTLRVGFRL